jgi:hypothetical protein
LKKGNRKDFKQLFFTFFMGGKTLRFPKRKKFVPGDEPVSKEEKEEKESISSEDHEKRLKMLRDIGLVK